MSYNNTFIILSYYTEYQQLRHTPTYKSFIYINRKCGVEFRLSLRWLWKDPNENKRYNAPHLDSMGTRTEVHSHITIQEMSAVRLSFHSENFHILLERPTKTPSICLLFYLNSTTKLKIISQTDNTLMGYCDI